MQKPLSSSCGQRGCFLSILYHSQLGLETLLLSLVLPGFQGMSSGIRRVVLNIQAADDGLSWFLPFPPPSFFEGSRVALSGRRTLRFHIIWCYEASAFMDATVALGCCCDCFACAVLLVVSEPCV